MAISQYEPGVSFCLLAAHPQALLYDQRNKKREIASAGCTVYNSSSHCSDLEVYTLAKHSSDYHVSRGVGHTLPQTRPMNGAYLRNETSADFHT